MSEASASAKRRWSRREPNPLLVKELRGRMRGARAFVVLTIYLLLLSCLASLIYYVYARTSGAPGGGPNTAYLGKVIFSSVVLFQLFFVSFIPSALTASAICGERERKTYEVLRTTLLSARRLVLGKLVSALAYVFLLILVAVPLQSLAFMLGGVEVEELVLALVILLVTAFTFAAVGLFCSSLVHTTRAATALSGGLVALMVLGPLLPIAILFSLLLDPILYGSTLPSLWQIVLVYLVYGMLSASPLTTAVFTETALEQYDSIWYFWQDFGSLAPSSYPSYRILIPAPWLVFIVLYLGLALLLLLLTVLRVRRQEVR